MQLEPRNSSFSTSISARSLDDVRLDHQIVVEEFGRIGRVGEDAADAGRGEENHLRSFRAIQAST